MCLGVVPHRTVVERMAPWRVEVYQRTGKLSGHDPSAGWWGGDPQGWWSSEVMLVYQMNGEDLKPAHGYPLRIIVPGWYGMASVTW
eukprot:Skav204326  [mRNA]  locus=scaffold660:312510:313051:+ [translate_table: standard]